MSRDLNKVLIIGRLGDSPELRLTAAGQQVANMSVAANNRYTNGAGEKVDDVAWHRVVLWGKTAELAARYLSKGSRVHIEGRLQYRKWQDKQGVDRSTAEIVADEVIYLDTASVGDASVRSNGRVQPAELI